MLLGVFKLVDLSSRTDFFFVIGRLYIYSFEFHSYSHTISYLKDKTLWWTRRPLPLPPYLNIIFTYQKLVWITFLVSASIIIFSWITLSNYQHEQINKLDLVFSIVTILIQNAHPRLQTIPIPILSVTWIWCTMILAISFNCISFTLFSKHIYGDEVTTTEQAVTLPDSSFSYANFEGYKYAGPINYKILKYNMIFSR